MPLDFNEKQHKHVVKLLHSLTSRFGGDFRELYAHCKHSLQKYSSLPTILQKDNDAKFEGLKEKLQINALHEKAEIFTLLYNHLNDSNNEFAAMLDSDELQQQSENKSESASSGGAVWQLTYEETQLNLIHFLFLVQYAPLHKQFSADWFMRVRSHVQSVSNQNRGQGMTAEQKINWTEELQFSDDIMQFVSFPSSSSSEQEEEEEPINKQICKLNKKPNEKEQENFPLIIYNFVRQKQQNSITNADCNSRSYNRDYSSSSDSAEELSYMKNRNIKTNNKIFKRLTEEEKKTEEPPYWQKLSSQMPVSYSDCSPISSSSIKSVQLEELQIVQEMLYAMFVCTNYTSFTSAGESDYLSSYHTDLFKPIGCKSDTNSLISNNQMRFVGFFSSATEQPINIHLESISNQLLINILQHQFVEAILNKLYQLQCVLRFADNHNQNQTHKVSLCVHTFIGEVRDAIGRFSKEFLVPLDQLLMRLDACNAENYESIPNELEEEQRISLLSFLTRLEHCDWICVLLNCHWLIISLTNNRFEKLLTANHNQQQPINIDVRLVDSLEILANQMFSWLTFDSAHSEKEKRKNTESFISEFFQKAFQKILFAFTTLPLRNMLLCVKEEADAKNDSFIDNSFPIFDWTKTVAQPSTSMQVLPRFLHLIGQPLMKICGAVRLYRQISLAAEQKMSTKITDKKQQPVVFERLLKRFYNTLIEAKIISGRYNDDNNEDDDDYHGDESGDREREFASFLPADSAARLARMLSDSPGLEAFWNDLKGEGEYHNQNARLRQKPTDMKFNQSGAPANQNHSSHHLLQRQHRRLLHIHAQRIGQHLALHTLLRHCNLIGCLHILRAMFTMNCSSSTMSGCGMMMDPILELNHNLFQFIALHHHQPNHQLNQQSFWRQIQPCHIATVKRWLDDASRKLIRQQRHNHHHHHHHETWPINMKFRFELANDSAPHPTFLIGEETGKESKQECGRMTGIGGGLGGGGNTAVHNLRLVCDVNWPHTLLLSHPIGRGGTTHLTCLTLASDIHAFLLQIFLVKRQLEVLSNSSKIKNRRSGVTSCSSDDAAAAHRLDILRFRLLHLINSLHTHITSNVLAANWFQFDRLLEANQEGAARIGDVEDLRAALNSLFLKMHRASFLTTNSSQAFFKVRQIFRNIFQLAKKFSLLYTAFYEEEGNESSLSPPLSLSSHQQQQTQQQSSSSSKAEKRNFASAITELEFNIDRSLRLIVQFLKALINSNELKSETVDSIQPLLASFLANHHSEH